MLPAIVPGAYLIKTMFHKTYNHICRYIQSWCKFPEELRQAKEWRDFYDYIQKSTKERDHCNSGSDYSDNTSNNANSFQ